MFGRFTLTDYWDNPHKYTDFYVSLYSFRWLIKYYLFPRLVKNVFVNLTTGGFRPIFWQLITFYSRRYLFHISINLLSFWMLSFLFSSIILRCKFTIRLIKYTCWIWCRWEYCSHSQISWIYLKHSYTSNWIKPKALYNFLFRLPNSISENPTLYLWGETRRQVFGYKFSLWYIVM